MGKTGSKLVHDIRPGDMFGRLRTMTMARFRTDSKSLPAVTCKIDLS